MVLAEQASLTSVRALIRVPGSFRDPHGFVFLRDGVVFRQVQPAGGEDYDRLMSSGLYAALVARRLLVEHVEEPGGNGAHKILRPEQLRFLSWPFEWPFGALQAAAVLTIDVAIAALAHGMVLRDASGYNVQFRGAAPVFIDTLSFGTYREGEPWVAYGQFCRHFLAPLALMARVDVRLASLLRSHIDGLPLDLTSSLLPWHSWLSPGLLVHLHGHARFKTKPTDSDSQIARGKAAKRASVSKTGLLGLLDSLRSIVSGLSWRPKGTTWGSYYSETNYSGDAISAKERLVTELVARCPANGIVWDLGGNTGRMLKAALPTGSYGVALDIDPLAVQLGFQESTGNQETRVVHLLADFSNPSPSQGWAEKERAGLVERGPADVALALALVHHLVIGNNVPLVHLAAFLASIACHVVIEFVPKDDSQVIRMLSGREDIFSDYHEDGFQAAMRTQFDVAERVCIPNTSRTLWRLDRRQPQ